MTIELDEGEREALSELVDRRLHDLVIEISRTDAIDYKDRLKDERSRLEQLHQRLHWGAVVA